MKRALLAMSLTLGLVAGTGCTNVQKGMGIGAATGAGAGAAYGHYVSAAGGGVGALVGAGVGGLGGAIAGEYFYGEDEENIEEALAMQQALEDEQARAARLESEVADLEKQKQALLAELERTRDNLNAGQPAAADEPQATVNRETLTLVVPFKSDVLFDSGKATLSKAGRTEIHKAVQTIRGKFPNAEIQVHGHTDSTPIRYSGFRSNWELSTARAVEVVHYLIEKEGFKADRLRAVGFGDTRPVASNGTAAGRARNRRAELVVTPVQSK